MGSHSRDTADDGGGAGGDYKRINMIFKDLSFGRIINGDFREYGDLPRDGFIVSDPPYNQNYHYNKYLDNIDDMDYYRLLESAFGKNRCVAVSYPELAINILSKIRDCNEAVSWVYNSNTAKQSRLITWWGCRPDFKKIGQPYKNPKDKRISARIAAGKSARLYDWWNINQVKNVSKKDNPHPCPMPLEVMKRIILITTNPGDLVIDPFMGSGTTGLACVITGRRFLGFEIDPIYFDTAEKRLSIAQPQ